MEVLHNIVLQIEFQIITPLCVRLNLEMVVLQYIGPTLME